MLEEQSHIKLLIFFALIYLLTEGSRSTSWKINMLNFIFCARSNPAFNSFPRLNFRSSLLCSMIKIWKDLRWFESHWIVQRRWYRTTHLSRGHWDNKSVIWGMNWSKCTWRFCSACTSRKGTMIATCDSSLISCLIFLSGERSPFSWLCSAFDRFRFTESTDFMFSFLLTIDNRIWLAWAEYIISWLCHYLGRYENYLDYRNQRTQEDIYEYKRLLSGSSLPIE